MNLENIDKRQLIVDNLKLIKIICNKYTKDDLFYSECIEKLLSRIEKYDNTKYKLSMWLNLVIKGYYFNTLRGLTNITNLKLLDIDFVNESKLGQDFKFERDFINILLKDIKKRFGVKKLGIFIRHLHGYKISELAERYNILEPTIKTIVSKIRVYVNQKYKNEKKNHLLTS